MEKKLNSSKEISKINVGLQDLKDLVNAEKLFIKQDIDILKIVTPFERNNRYVIRNTAGKQVFLAQERSHCCWRFCCGTKRPFTITIYDNKNNEVLRLEKKFTIILDRLIVKTNTDSVIGTIKQNCSLCLRNFDVYVSDQKILRIEGPICPCGKLVNFKIFNLAGNEIGRVQKVWAGIVQELFTDADNFEISFPLNLDVRAKAVLLATVFLFDMMYFETDT